jgi:hypothetical protein
MNIGLLALMLAAPPAIDFARDVRPILADKCFHCHGPDEAARKAGLRLDTHDGALALLKKGAAVVPGDAAKSRMIARIHDDDDPMPPTDANRALTAEQKATLKSWVEAGAKWGVHWSLTPLPKTVTVPNNRSLPIDAFIHERLKAQGLAMSPAATKEAWLRRVTFDLTGLPPTIAEIDAFTKDTSKQAWNTVLDRLFRSPRYGERMASDWLDLARYADTYGYQSDQPCAMWPYRDWVIDAFNRNLRYDLFLTEQLAGDLLPNPKLSQRVATAFNRLHMQNEEGGIIEEEFRVAYVVDRVNTFGTAFLGQTFECSRCHDHKYDPITQKDYYSLFSFFQNIDESGQTSHFTKSMNTPTLLLPTPPQEAQIAILQFKVKQAEAELKSAHTAGHAAFAKWKAERADVEVMKGVTDNFAFFNMKDGQVPNATSADVKKKPGKAHESPMVDGKFVRLNGENGFDLGGVGHFSRSDPFSLEIKIKAESFVPRAVILHHSKAPIDAGSRGYELLLENGRLAFGLHHMWPGNAVKVRTRKPIANNQWTRIVVTADGSGTAAGMRIYANGWPAEVDVIRDQLTKDITYPGGEPPLQVGYRFRDNGFKNGCVTALTIYDRAVTPYEVATSNTDDVVDVTADQERDFYLSAYDQPSLKALEKLKAARKELAKFIEPIPEIMVMSELPTPKPAFVLKRGAYDSPGEAVTADTPKSLPAFKSEFARNRLGLALWLREPDHPLTARVMVNRLWQQMFGRGLVESSDNFGSTGTPPTHPELLDWLARDFVDHGWDIQRTLRMIATSDAYRQSSRTTPEVRAKDPYNLLLARAPVRRLSAEMLRDQALFTSGLLQEKQGGPSVFPYQPAGLWNDAMGRPPYPQSKGFDLYRRSLYTHWKRTAPPPAMLTFDSADRSNCAAKRQSTSTPLQALVLLNDPTYIEAARVLAEKLVTEHTESEVRIKSAFRIIVGRAASEAEFKVLEQCLIEQTNLYCTDEAAADKLLAVGATKPKKDMVKAVVAGMTQVNLTLFNHEECVNRR